jgi:hypothetical protein
MRSLKEFKETPVVEEEKQDYSKFDALVRAGLANRTQLQRLHRILAKMSEERPTFNSTDRTLIQGLFNKMTDLITNNKQIFQKTKLAVREEIEEFTEAHKNSNEDPPFVLILRRKAIRLFPNSQKVALYYNAKLDKSFSVPYGLGIDGVIQAENLADGINTLDEDAISQLQKIKNEHQHGTVKHNDGTSSKVDVQTAHAILTVHKNLNDENKKKFAAMVGKSNQHLQKAAEFSWKNMKW